MGILGGDRTIYILIEVGVTVYICQNSEDYTLKIYYK